MRVAALFAGWQQSTIDGANLRDALLAPLHAEPLVLLTYRAGVDACDSVRTCGLRERLAALEPAH